MGRRLRNVGEASSLCAPERSKARRFAYARLAAAHRSGALTEPGRLLRAFRGLASAEPVIYSTIYLGDDAIDRHR
jgi:hypothetical protein